MNSTTLLKTTRFSSTKSVPKKLGRETLIPQKVPQAWQLFRIIVSHVHNITFQCPHQLTFSVPYHHTCAMLFHLQVSREIMFLHVFTVWILNEHWVSGPKPTWFFQIWTISCFHCNSSWRFVRLMKFGKMGWKNIQSLEMSQLEIRAGDKKYVLSLQMAQLPMP